MLTLPRDKGAARGGRRTGRGCQVGKSFNPDRFLANSSDDVAGFSPGWDRQKGTLYGALQSPHGPAAESTGSSRTRERDGTEKPCASPTSTRGAGWLIRGFDTARRFLAWASPHEK